MVPAVPSEDRRATRWLRPKRESHSLLRALVSRLSQPGDFVVDLLAINLSAAVACFTGLCCTMVVECEAILECRRLEKEVLLGKLAKAAPGAGMDVSLSGEKAEASELAARLLSDVVAADPLCSLPDELRLYQCFVLDLLVCLGSVYRNAKFANTHSMRLVHCRGEPYCRRMREGYVKQLRRSYAFFCAVTIAPS